MLFRSAHLQARGSSKAPGTMVSMMFSSFTLDSFNAALAPSTRSSMISLCQRARMIPIRTSEPSSSSKVTPPAMDGAEARRAAKAEEQPLGDLEAELFEAAAMVCVARDLMKMTVLELKDELQARGATRTGALKSVLRGRLRAVIVAAHSKEVAAAERAAAGAPANVRKRTREGGE